MLKDGGIHDWLARVTAAAVAAAAAPAGGFSLKVTAACTRSILLISTRQQRLLSF